jgi:hypothetical protein
MGAISPARNLGLWEKDDLEAHRRDRARPWAFASSHGITLSGDASYAARRTLDLHSLRVDQSWLSRLRRDAVPDDFRQVQTILYAERRDFFDGG